MTTPAKRISEYLRENGPASTRNLRSGTWLSGRGKKSACERSMVDLQCRFIACKVGLTGRTGGKYGYIRDLTDR